jgi:hypothetical protein
VNCVETAPAGLVNSASATVSTGRSVTGTNAAEFAVTGGTRRASLAGGTSCTYLLKFTPSVDGAECDARGQRVRRFGDPAQREPRRHGQLRRNSAAGISC